MPEFPGRVWWLVLVALAASAATLRAQPLVPMLDGAEATAALAATGAGVGEERRCLDWPADGRRTIATVTAGPAGAPWKVGIPQQAWPGIVQLTERVGAHLRARLGAEPGRLAAPHDSVFNWRQLGGHLHVVAYRTGVLLWWPSASTPFHEPLRDSASAIGERMLADAMEGTFQADGGFAWPDSVASDSIAFMLRFAWPLPRRDTTALVPIPAVHVAPIAPLLVPIVGEVEPLETPRIQYPRVAQEEGFEALIRLEFTVDTAGRVVRGSVRDIWDTPAPRPRGQSLRVYRQFVAAAEAGVLRARYKPASVGRCTVAMPVTQEFTFALER